jgi:hypothetical protein
MILQILSELLFFRTLHGRRCMSSDPYKNPPELQHSYLGNDVPKTNFLKWFAVIGIVLGLIGLLLPAVRSARPAAYRMQCTNNLKQIALALRNYESTYHSFPPAATFDSSGNPLHSWRTLILPFLEQAALYDSIDLTKPWDDPANAKAYGANIPVYHCPSLGSDSLGSTTYLGVVASNGFFLPTGTRRLSEIIDSPSATLMVVEVSSVNSVHWMQPVDANELTVLSMNERSKLAHENGFHAAFVDGSIRFLRGTDLSQEDRRAMISVAGHDNAF